MKVAIIVSGGALIEITSLDSLRDDFINLCS